MCRLLQQETSLARKAAEASGALPGIQTSLEQNQAQATACTQKAEGLRQRRQRLQVRRILSRTLALVSCNAVISRDWCSKRSLA